MTLPPAPTPDAVAAVLETRRRLGAAFPGPARVLEVTGPDALSFLQSQLPADLVSLAPGTGVFTARLDDKGRLRALFPVLRLEDRLWLIVPAEGAEALREDLERYHIAEELTLTIRDDLEVSEIHGPEMPALLAAASGAKVSLEPFHHRPVVPGGVEARFVSDPWTGDVGGRLVHAAGAGAALARGLLPENAAPPAVLDREALELLRIEGGRPRLGVEVDDRTLLPELGRDEEMVSFTKGCFLGQETVARVHSRGRVNRLLRGLLLEGDHVPEPGALLVAGGTPVGEIRSAVRSPSLDRGVALAFVRRGHFDSGDLVHVRMGGALVPAEVVEPPLYRRPGPGEQADRFYREGLEAFQEDRFAEAERHFERALLMNPSHHAALEALGVAQERQGRLDEALETMQALADSDPDSVMAWTNISRYLAEQGRIPEAEEAKGRALRLSWKAEAGEAEARRRAEEQEAARRRELEERVELFRQVLEIDPDDGIANFGLGKILLDLGRPGEAEPLLRRAVEGKEDYSSAWSQLGRALLELGRRDEGIAVLEKGIEVAARGGDLMPKREMERLRAEAVAAGSPGMEENGHA